MHYTCSGKVLKTRAEAVIAALGPDETEIPLRAVKLADGLGIKGNRENKRRRVREAVTYAREQLGYCICGNADGYWMARGPSEWAAYNAAVKAKARFAFVRMSRASRAIAERLGGQGLLFETAGRVG